MKKMLKTITIGLILIILAILIAIFFEPDFSFFLAGVGIIVIGFAFLAYINKTNKTK